MTIKIDYVNDKLGGTGVTLEPMGRGFAFRKDGELIPLSEFTTKKAIHLSTEQLIAFGREVADGYAPQKVARESKADRMKRNEETHEVIARLAGGDAKTYSVETKEISPGWNDSGYRFRIVCSDGRFSGWAPYDRVCFLDDTAALSPYFHGGSDTQTMSLKEAMAHIAIGEHVEQTAVARDDEDDGAVEIDDTAN